MESGLVVIAVKPFSPGVSPFLPHRVYNMLHMVTDKVKSVAHSAVMPSALAMTQPRTQVQGCSLP